MDDLNIYPLTGIFYFHDNKLIAPMDYQREIDPRTKIVTRKGNINNPGEHRDLWDNYMVKEYPELIHLYDDNHKLFPRGRVGFYIDKGTLSFLITLDKCIQGLESEIKSIYHLEGYDVEFSYGTLNYVCLNCKTS